MYNKVCYNLNTVEDKMLNKNKKGGKKMAFNYNQLNLVARDRSSVEFWITALTKELNSLRDRVSVNSEAFKNVVKIANEVWEGEDKELFIKALTASAKEYTTSIEVVRDNIKKYLEQDLKDFEYVQRVSKSIID